ncbi:hypothetical protein P7B02_02695 [Caulobacter segnis]|uniref:hypothetical protein n=1 Tax=Caulobacter segnis TaxID=88688 RepID=UPI00240F4403|nr:hypothetical protein [Caulobacter segnis]MDG2520436.1 hypothetical protein [Caulobacter segnis]
MSSQYRLASAFFTLGLILGAATAVCGFFAMVATGYGLGFWVGAALTLLGLAMCWLALSARHMLRWWPGKAED